MHFESGFSLSTEAGIVVTVNHLILQCIVRTGLKYSLAKSHPNRMDFGLRSSV